LTNADYLTERMMLDYSRLNDREAAIADRVAGLTVEDLRALTNGMIDRQLALIADCIDEDVVFVPSDPEAYDRYAVDESETYIAWTLGHIIVHVTASAEESAFLAAEMARGIVRGGRTRYETPWPTVTTLAQCRQRLAESRRMRLAMLDVWPDAPHLDSLTPYTPYREPMNAIGRFVHGLDHDADHLEQLAEIVRQAHAARQATG
jgi:hypothetical protein